MGDVLGTVLTLLLACFAPSLFWLAYWTWRASLGESWRQLGLAPVAVFFGAGLLAGPLALGFYHFMELSPFYEKIVAIDGVSELDKFVYSLFAIGTVEETAKFLVAWVAMRALRGRGDPLLGGPVYAAAAALGFASIENWYYMIDVDHVVWHRALTLPFNHVLFSSFWGVGLSLYHLRLPGAGLWLAASLVLSIVYHGLYDYILLSAHIPNLWVLPVVLLLWVWMMLAIPRLRRGVRRARRTRTP